MNKYTFLLFITILSSLHGLNYADQPVYKNKYWTQDKSISLPKTIQQSIERLKTKSAERVLEELLEDSPVLKRQESTQSLKSKFENLHNQGGHFLDYQIISKSKLGSFYKRFALILRYRNAPIFVEIDLYLNDNDWAVNRISLGKDPDIVFRTQK